MRVRHKNATRIRQQILKPVLPLTGRAALAYISLHTCALCYLARESKTVSAKKNQEPEVVGFVGVGMDNSDGHQRVTRTENLLLVGGSQETHEKMQDVSIRFNESLEKRGKRLQDTSVPEVVDLMRQALDR
jgi:hypothetical protein